MKTMQHTGCAKYVGRVGALAVALGIGAAVASTPATAWADSGKSESDSSSTSSETSAQSPTKQSPTKQSPTEPSPKTEAEPAGSDRDDEGAPADEDSPAEATDEDSTEDEDSADEDSADTEADEDSTASQTTPSRTTPSRTKDEDTREKYDTPEKKDVTGDVPDAGTGTTVDAAQEDGTPAEPTSRPTDDNAPTVSLTNSATTAPHSTAAPQPEPATRAAAPAPAPDLFGMISASLASLFAPAPDNSGGGAVTMWTMLAWARGQFYNSRPEFDYRPGVDESLALDGTDHITIANRATDPDGDPVRVVAVTSGAKGTVTVNPDGSLTYDPGQSYDGDDTFTVTVSDEGPGRPLRLFDFLGFSGTTTSTHTINVTLDVQAAAPSDSTDVTGIRHNAQEPGILVRYSSDGSRAYIRTFKSETFDATITVVDTATGAVIHDFDVPGTEYASDIELSPDGRHLIIARQGGQAYWIDTVDTETGETTTISGVQQVGYPNLELSPDATRTLISWRDPATRNYHTTVIDTATGNTLGAIENGVSVPVYHFGNDGGFLITDAFDVVVAVDADGNVLDRVNAGGGVGTVIRHPDRPVTYIANFDAAGQMHYVAVLDDTTNEVIARIPVESGAAPTLTLAPDGNRLYLSSGARIQVLDTQTNTVVGSFTAPGAVGPTAVSADNATVYVVSSAQAAQANSLLAVDATTGQITGTVDLGDSVVDQMVVSADGTTAYVAGRAGDGSTTTIMVVDLQTNTVTGTVHSVDNATATDLQLSGNGGLLLANVTDDDVYGYSRVVVIATGAVEFVRV